MDTQAKPGGTVAHSCGDGLLLLHHLQSDDIDAAIEAGLMHYLPCPTCERALAVELDKARQKLSAAWAARDRYLARNARLARRVAEREAKRASAIPERKSALPAGAAAILARATAKAAERRKQ